MSNAGTTAARPVSTIGRWVTEAVIVAVIGFLSGVGGAWFGLISKDHELKIKLVEIGIGILRADPKEKVTPARAWAIRLIEHSSGEPFLEEERKALLDGPLVTTSFGYTDVEYNDTYTPDARPKPPRPNK